MCIRDSKGGLKEALEGADVFIGVSKPGILTTELCRTMNKDAIVFHGPAPVSYTHLVRFPRQLAPGIAARDRVADLDFRSVAVDHIQLHRLELVAAPLSLFLNLKVA